jgi:alkanesulfonate monooxygenase SsuD/methylene tetrahydromethanopterin reductase-like flavin-dependent oxidoreductase (luciferase family)
VTAEPGQAAVAPAAAAVDLFLTAAQIGGRGAAEALRTAVEYAVAAEDAGFDGVWFAEHHFVSYGSCPSAVTLAAHVAGRTTRIEVGTAAVILPNRNPVALAEEAAMLDALSGRFMLGVARGGPWVDREVFGAADFNESLDLLLAAVSGAPTVSGPGFGAVPLVPRPASPLPVWVAATSPPTVELAARRGLPLLLGMHEDPAPLLDHYRRHNAEPVPHGTVHLVSFDDVETYRKRLLDWQTRALEHPRLAPAPDRDVPAYVDRLVRLHPPGTPAEILARLTRSHGVSRLLLAVEAAEDVASTIHTLGVAVLPGLRSAR